MVNLYAAGKALDVPVSAYTLKVRVTFSIDAGDNKDDVPPQAACANSATLTAENDRARRRNVRALKEQSNSVVPMAEANSEVTAQLVSGQAVQSLDFTPREAHRSKMATIRDLVGALRRRDGVDAVIVLGRDGLLIDGAADGALDPDGLAAHVPPMVAAAIDMGSAAGRGSFTLMVLEYGAGTAIVTSVSPEAILLVLLREGANLAALLYDLRRHRAQIAAIV